MTSVADTASVREACVIIPTTKYEQKYSHNANLDQECTAPMSNEQLPAPHADSVNIQQILESCVNRACTVHTLGFQSAPMREAQAAQSSDKLEGTANVGFDVFSSCSRSAFLSPACSAEGSACAGGPVAVIPRHRLTVESAHPFICTPRQVVAH